MPRNLQETASETTLPSSGFHPQMGVPPINPSNMDNKPIKPPTQIPLFILSHFISIQCPTAELSGPEQTLSEARGASNGSDCSERPCENYLLNLRGREEGGQINYLLEYLVFTVIL